MPNLQPPPHHHHLLPLACHLFSTEHPTPRIPNSYSCCCPCCCSCSSQKASCGDISGTKRGIIDTLVLKRRAPNTSSLFICVQVPFADKPFCNHLFKQLGSQLRLNLDSVTKIPKVADSKSALLCFSLFCMLANLLASS